MYGVSDRNISQLSTIPTPEGRKQKYGNIGVKSGLAGPFRLYTVSAATQELFSRCELYSILVISLACLYYADSYYESENVVVDSGRDM